MFNESRSSSRQKENQGYPVPKNISQKDNFGSLIKGMGQMTIGH